MHVARHGAGVRAGLDALFSQIHPVFMLPPLAASLFGGILAGGLDPLAAGLHTAAIFLAVYTAHVKDGYVDYHIRGEDDDHPLTVAGCRVALLGATTAFAITTIAIAIAVSPMTAIITVPTWFIGYAHAPTLDVHAVTTTLGYPTGIALALLGGHHAQSGTLSAEAVAFAAIFVVLLAGVKIIDDSQDYAYDLSIQKRTVAVALGPRNARLLAFTLQGVAMLVTIGAALIQLIPVASLVAVAAFGLVAGIASRADPETATMLLVRGAYVFLAGLVAAVWFRPFG